MYFNHVIGVDSDAGTLRMVEMRRRFLRLSAPRVYRLHIPDDPAEAQLVLGRFSRAQKMHDTACIMGIGSEEVLLRIFQLGSVPRRLLAQRAQETLDQFRTFPSEGTLEAYSILRSSSGGSRMLVGLSRRDALEKTLQAPTEAGWNIASVVPAPLAAFLAAGSLLARRKSSFLTLYMQQDKTLIAAGRGRDLQHIWTCNMGRRDIIPQGDEPADVKTVERWLQEINSCLQAAASETGQTRHRTESIVAGGTAPLPPEIIRKLEQTSGRKIFQVEELVKQAGLPEELSQNLIAYGLALSGLGKKATLINLLPSGMKQRLALRWQFKYWAGCTLVMLLGLLLATGTLRLKRKRYKREYERTSQQLLNYQELDISLRKTVELNRGLRQRLGPLSRSVRKGPVIHQIIAAVAQAKHTDDWISLIADSSSYFETVNPEVNADTSAPQAPETRFMENVVVEGFTPSTDFSTIRAMIETLRNNPIIASADLLGDDRVIDETERDKRWSFTDARRFAIEIKLNGATSK